MPAAVVTIPDDMIGQLESMLAGLIEDPGATYAIPAGLEDMEVEEVIAQRVTVTLSDGDVCDLALTWASDTAMMAVHVDLLDEEEENEEANDGAVCE